MKSARKLFLLLLIFSISICCLSGCKKSELDKNKPVTLTMWHVYGEQADSPMNRLIDEFNETVGVEKGIIINVTAMSNASKIGEKLLDAHNKIPGSAEMPDLFFAHKSNVLELGADCLLDWNEYFSEKELSAYIPEFLEDGTAAGKLSVFPVSKSTHLLFIAGGQFERFSADTGVTYEALSTWDGFFDAAAKYYDWSGGKPFCALDYPLRAIELAATESGAGNIFADNGFYDPSNVIFKQTFIKFADSLAKGHIMLSNLYSNTQVMTGEVVAGIGSSAAILYYNDTVTYEDGTSEPMDPEILPLPAENGKKPYITQAGVGLCAYKTTSQKAEASAIFAKWLTEPERNLEFVCQTGYMPVTNGAFEKIDDCRFKTADYEKLYAALKKVKESSEVLSEQQSPEYYSKVYAFYDYLRNEQKQFILSNTPPEALAEGLWQKLCEK
ncbi:MAG: extracellular solute-binding protein [Clostridiales bacterium]|jgi:multiple sugar transport system substrate-binding protein|nr:extracellular solute-binding protein [Clostridiales bacterium]